MVSGTKAEIDSGALFCRNARCQGGRQNNRQAAVNIKKINHAVFMIIVPASSQRNDDLSYYPRAWPCI